MPRNIAEFRIIGQVGGKDEKEKVTYINVASNYNRKDEAGEWQEDTHWNRVTCFGKQREYAEKISKGDLVHITGRTRQGTYEAEGRTHYTTDFIVETISVLSRADKDSEG